jgi:hypothetical protein
MDGSPRRGYSLASLFVLVTACAALVAGFTPLARHGGAEGIGVNSLLVALWRYVERGVVPEGAVLKTDLRLH